MTNHPRARLSIVATAIFATMLGVSACASNPRRELLGRSLTAPSANLITEAEIDGAHGRTAYEVIQQTRPIFLASQVELAPLMERQVYLNGVRLGGVEELRWIPASSISSIRFVRAGEGGGTGSGRTGAVILVVSKVAR